jgi:hypothetical protein
MNDRIANLVKAVREAEPRETLEKFDVGKIERSNETLDEFVASGSNLTLGARA